MKCALGLLLLVSCCRPLPAADLAKAIQDTLDASPAARAAFWGIQVIEQGTGAVVYELNADHFFVPASNTKLFTTALALRRLGPDYRFRTTVRMDPSGSIRLIGGGDPNLSNRLIPYRSGPVPGNPLRPLEELAEQVVARGIRSVPGDVIGDDTAYVWQPFPNGWAADDAVWDYGAPASALTINDNMLTLTAQAGEHDGDAVAISLWPGVEYYEIDSRIKTEARPEKRVTVDRVPGSIQLRLWGSLAPRASYVETLGIDDPALFAARAFYEALTKRGVNVGGRPVAQHLYPNQVRDLRIGVAPEAPAGEEIASRTSSRLLEDLRITDKISHNLHAELLLRAVGRARRQIGSRQAGLEEMRSFLTGVGLDVESYRFEDGSGLSRLNLVQPRAVVLLLRSMFATPYWVGLLPVGGEDGTLGRRFVNTPAARRIHAKTGTLSHVSALSGYAERKSGGVRTFSILVNNYSANGSSEVRAVIDKICNLMVE